MTFLTSATSPLTKQRFRLSIQGAVQGVGFRPFIYQLATHLHLTGWVSNSVQGVLIEIEGQSDHLDTFLRRLELDKPPRSHIQHLAITVLESIGDTTFEIRESGDKGKKTAIVLPDLATCPACLQELFDENDRRYRYPFINCTHCGPRFSIIDALPYDRPNTTMKQFEMCEHCQTEYQNPFDRRFHAQPNACPNCGPHLELWNRAGQVLCAQDAALRSAAEAIRQGQIVAMKGLGGFHLLVDATCEVAVQRLRQFKQREAKPFALMYPSLAIVKAHCEVSELEELLLSIEAPIVLLRRLGGDPPKSPLKRGTYERSLNAVRTMSLASSVAPGTPYLGIMLPYTPLHHLLMQELKFPVVATSGNLADEPICIDNSEALERLRDLADVFLVHDRPIAQPIDDSIVRVVMERPMLLRRARGFAPLPITLSESVPTVLAVGAHLKNTIALSVQNQIFVSQHIGDLATISATEAFEHAIASLQSLYDVQPTAIACDIHPDYASTRFAQQYGQKLGLPVIPVQHHYAHALACTAEHHLEGSVLAIAWDGTGYGLDGTIWGGEALHITDTGFQRIAHLRQFHLPGSDRAIREPRRAALGVLYELFGEEVFEMNHLAPVQAFSGQELGTLKTMFKRNLNTPVTFSVGRLFDAIASIIGLRQQTQFEGQTAMALEFAAEDTVIDEQYEFELLNSNPILIDWAPMVKQILADYYSGLSVEQLSDKFHNTLVEIIVAVVKCIGEERVVLTGGCFQNKYLTEKTVQQLRSAGFQPYWHQSIPANDGGIAIGQVMAAVRELRKAPCV